MLHCSISFIKSLCYPRLLFYIFFFYISIAIIVNALFCLSAEPPRVGNPCQPSPCGPNSECREKNGGAACSCLAGYKGAPPACRPECVLNRDCPIYLACIGQKCVDPCEGECGQNARCTVQNHRPVCRCTSGFTGDPFQYCSPIPQSEFITICIHEMLMHAYCIMVQMIFL